MENASTPIYTSHSELQFPITHEQHQILSLNHIGTGKNATLGRYAEQRPHLRFLYMAFNVSLANDFYTKCDNQCTFKYRGFFTARQGRRCGYIH